MMNGSTRAGSNIIRRVIRIRRFADAGIGSASCKRASTRMITIPRWRRDRGRNSFSGRRRRSSKWPNTTSMTRWREPHGMTRHRPTNGPGIGRLWPHITISSRRGPRTVRRTSPIARRWSAPRSPGLTAAIGTRWTFTNRPSARPATTASSTTRRSPTNGPDASTPGLDFETISHAYLRNARYGYARWGADAKVRQLDEAYPRLKDDLPVVAGPTSTIGTPSNTLTWRP